jgi:effector-binding domain-containing protein
MRYYREHADDSLKVEDYASASDYFSLASFTAIIADNIPQAKFFADEALNACAMGNLKDEHLELAKTAKALSSGNPEEAEKHWNKIKSKLQEEIVNLYHGALKKV